MSESGVVEAARSLRAVVDELLAAPLCTPSGVELVEALDELEVQRRRLAAVDQRLVAQLAERYTAGEFGATDTASLLTQRLRVTPAEARARVARARDLGPRRAVTGQPLAPLLAQVAAAVEAGEVSADGHASVIAKVLDRIPADIAADAAPVAEAFLVQAARHQHPRALAQTGELLLARLDPDGRAPRDADTERRRDLTLISHADGSAIARGTLTAACAAALRTVLDALSAPRPSNDADGNAITDPRSAGQRRHDALHETLLRLLRSASLPAAGGVPVTILALTTVTDLARLLTESKATSDRHASSVQLDTAGAKTWADLCADDQPPPAAEKAGCPQTAGPSGARPAGAGPSVLAGLGGGAVRTGHGDVITLTQLLAMAADAEIIPVYCNDTGGILAYGRGIRLATRGQRLVLAARDRGCVMPGCDRPPAWCQVHHVVPWIELGPTDVDNLCLLCTHHHQTFQAQGWTIVMRDGLPHCIPPPWLDQQQRPIRNTAHHLPDITFDTVAG